MTFDSNITHLNNRLKLFRQHFVMFHVLNYISINHLKKNEKKMKHIRIFILSCTILYQIDLKKGKKENLSKCYE